ncbi:MAG: response regulator [Nitrospiraceae bacterium]|nr:response regulator [Nitrospiraceae bacterium]
MRILLIEDEKTLATTLKRGLSEEGYIVDLAYDGKNGYVLSRCRPYDIIILDLMLPGMDGMELLRKLRDKGLKTPALILTAKDSIKDKVDGLNSGADDYLTKPFSYDELLARIRVLLRRRNDLKTSKIKIYDLTIDTSNNCVKREDREIGLSKKEYQLLLLLITNKNRIVDRKLIMEKVYNDYPLSNAVDVLVNRLRNKLDKGFDVKLIHTVRGFGYMIKDED